MGEIIKREARSTSTYTAPQHAPRGPVDLGGRRLQDSTWDAGVLDLADADLDRIEGHIVASSVVDQNGGRRHTDGSYYRLRLGWVAMPDQIVVHRLEQPLRRSTDGKLHTAGPYTITDVTRHHATGPVPVRVGDIPADPPAAGHASTNQAAALPVHLVALQRRFHVAFTTMELLPAPVRRSITQRLTGATLFAGQAVRYDDGDRHEINLCAITPTGGIVVKALTHRDTTTWHVEQRVYTWPATTQLSTTPTRGQLR